MNEKGQRPPEKSVVEELGFDPWDHPIPLPERPAFEPVPVGKEVKRLFIVGAAITVGIVVGTIAFVVWLVKWSGG